jgi:subtilisin-like proprotein convertase family protein
LSGSQVAFSQLTVTQNASAQQLGNNIAGSNITVTNATATGDPAQFGTFDFTGSQLGIGTGIILSSGNVIEAEGPNSSNGTTGNFGGPGDPDLSILSGNDTYDAAVLEFDFQVQGDEVEFNFVFLSEEYNEYVNTGFNDVFAFYISGPGIPTPENLAVLPGTTTPITINNINNGLNSQYFVDNENGNVNIEFDGFTTPLKAVKAGLTPCATYTLSLRIADASDHVLDAAVLFEENSLIQPNLSASSYTFSSNNTALEGCYDASFTFLLDQVSTEDLIIPLLFGGTAVNGVDYALVDNYIVIPAGQTSGTVIIDAFLDGLTEGQEFVQFYYAPSLCAPFDSVMLFIDDYVPVEYDITPTDVTCNGYQNGQLDINIVGGFAPYTMTLTDSLTGNVTTHNSFPVTGLDAGTYFVEIIDAYGCSAEEIVSGNYLDAQISPIPDNKNGLYTSSLPISGFAIGETIQSAGQIQSVCMTIEHSRISELEIILTAPDGTEIYLKEPFGGSVTNFGEPCAVAPNDIGNGITDPGVGYNYCWQNNTAYGTMVGESSSQTYAYNNVCDGSVQIDYYLPSDAYLPYDSYNQLIGVPMNGNWSITVNDIVPINDGFVFDWSITLQSNLVDTLFTINEPALPTITSSLVNPTCGQNDGSIDLTISTGFPPFTFLWDNGAVTEDLTGIPAGIYTVDISDASGCVYSHQVNLSNSGTLSVTGSISDESCFQDADGAIDVSIAGSVNPVSYAWSSGQTSQDIQNVVPGNYTITVQDGIGCIGIESFNIIEAPQINISEIITNEQCNDGEGTIDISVIGATLPIIYFWNNVISTEDADNLASGTYSFTLQDSNNCVASSTYQIINLIGNCLPDCDLEISSSIIQNDSCGQSLGEIELIVFTTNGPTQTSWSNGATSNQISNLSIGNYDVTITDVEGCEVTNTFTVGNESGSLFINAMTATPTSCALNNGTINTNITGGTQPYSYLWSNGSTLQNATVLSAGFYTFTVTDDNNCSTSQTAEVISPSNTLAISFSDVDDANCNSATGEINIEISGGSTPYSYNWNTSPQGTQDQFNLAPGNYICVITDANGCSITTPTYVVNSSAGGLTIDDLNVDNEICFNAQGEIEVIVSGAAFPTNYNWSNGSISPSISGLSAGTYNCTITDANGCSISTGDIFILNESGSLNVDALTVIDEVCGNGDGALNLTVSGGNVPLSYQWSNFSNSQNITSISAGTYTCTITDAFGCEVYATGGVSNNPGTLAINNFITSSDSCGVGTIDLIISGGSAPISYLWNNGATTEDLSGLNNGNYFVDIIDNAGCSVSGSTLLSIASPGISLIDAVVNNQQCSNSGGAIDLIVSGGTLPYTYAWSNGATSEDLNGLSSGTYSCTITDANGCSIYTGNLIINNGSGGLSVLITSTTDDLCSNGTGNINTLVSGGTMPYSHLWSDLSTSHNLYGASSGTYSVVVTDSNGCTATAQETIYDDPGTLTVNNISITDEECGNAGGGINISISGGNPSYLYFWSNSTLTEDLNGVGEGIYSVFILDSLGCTITLDNLIVTNSPGQLQVDALNVTDENCGDGAGNIDLIISGNVGPISFLWSNGETTEDLGNLSSGIYSGTATDMNGCSVSFSTSVQDNSGGLNILSDISHLCGNSINNGAIDVFINGAGGNVTYAWSNGETTQNISNLTAGAYTLTVSDDSTCAITETFIVLPNGISPEINSTLFENASCATCEDGWIEINMVSPNSQNTFLWSNGATTKDLENLNPGSYAVVITSPDGCTVSQLFVIENTDPYKDVTECNFNLYPNPSDGLFEIRYIQWGDDTVELKVYDARGRPVFNGLADAPGTNGTIQLDLRNFAAGVYFLHLTPECGKAVYRLVIQ